MDFLGKWKVVTKTAMGKTEAIWHIFKENGEVKATIFADNALTPFDSVEVEGKHFAMDVKLKSLIGKMNFHMEGDVNGDIVSGTSKMKMGSAPFTGERLKEGVEPEETVESQQPVEAPIQQKSGKVKVLGISAGHNMGNSEMLLREALMGAEEAGQK